MSQDCVVVRQRSSSSVSAPPTGCEIGTFSIGKLVCLANQSGSIGSCPWGRLMYIAVGKTVMPRRLTGICLDARRSEPLYQQVFDQIVERVRSGTFPADYRLPPSRALAEELGAHRNTVVRAYADLEAAGFVVASVGR